MSMNNKLLVPHVEVSVSQKAQMNMKNEILMMEGRERTNSSNYRVVINGQPLWLDKGVAETVVVLNERGYKTTCCCEGHISYCEGYAQPQKRKEYGQYSPIFIDFMDDCLPPYGPGIYELDKDINPWKSDHAREYLGTYGSFKGKIKSNCLFISFECYKRDRKKYSNGDVHLEHERVLNLLLEWAKGLPQH